MTTFLYLDTNHPLSQTLDCFYSVASIEKCVLNLQVGLFQVSVWPFQVTKSKRSSKSNNFFGFALCQGVGCLLAGLRGRTAEGRRGVTDRFIVRLRAPGRAWLLSASLMAPSMRPVTLRQWARLSRKADLCESLGCVAIARGHGASDGETHTGVDGSARPESCTSAG